MYMEVKDIELKFFNDKLEEDEENTNKEDNIVKTSLSKRLKKKGPKVDK